MCPTEVEDGGATDREPSTEVNPVSTPPSCMTGKLLPPDRSKRKETANYEGRDRDIRPPEPQLGCSSQLDPRILSTIVIYTFNLCKVQSIADNCGEWVECMGMANGYCEKEVGVASGSGWNLWVWLLGVVVRSI